MFKKFFAPHPGVGGLADPRLPANVKKIVDELDGAVVSLESVLKRLSEATPGTVIVEEGENFISLFLNAEGKLCRFKLISFKDPGVLGGGV